MPCAHQVDELADVADVTVVPVAAARFEHGRGHATRRRPRAAVGGARAEPEQQPQSVRGGEGGAARILVVVGLATLGEPAPEPAARLGLVRVAAALEQLADERDHLGRQPRGRGGVARPGRDRLDEVSGEEELKERAMREADSIAVAREEPATERLQHGRAGRH
jgi:hypothetical protein